MMTQGNKRKRWSSVDFSIQPQGKKILAMAWIDNKMVYDMVIQSWTIDDVAMYKISKVIKFITKVMENGESGINRCRKHFSWGENPERDLPSRCTITIIICNDTTKSHAYKIQMMIYELAIKDQPPNIHGWAAFIVRQNMAIVSEAKAREHQDLNNFIKQYFHMIMIKNRVLQNSQFLIVLLAFVRAQ